MATSTKSRFDFPGFKHIRNQDTTSHEVVIGEIVVGSQVFRIEMIRSKNAPRGGSFLPANIKVGERTVWQFKDQNFCGLGRLAIAGGMPVVALISSDDKIVQITPLEDMPNLIPMKVGGEVYFIGGKQRSLEDIRNLKISAAKFLSLKGIRYTSSEKMAAEILEERNKEKVEKERRKQEAERAEQMVRIRTRSRIAVRTEDGRNLNGIPVTEDEWPRLQDGTYAILVERYDDKTGIPGRVIEAFVVGKKKGGECFKREVSAIPPEKPAMPAAEEIIHIDRGNGFEPTLVFASLAKIRQAQEAGLNSGTLAAVKVHDSLRVFSVLTSELSQVRKFSVLKS